MRKTTQVLTNLLQFFCFDRRSRPGVLRELLDRRFEIIDVIVYFSFVGKIDVVDGCKCGNIGWWKYLVAVVDEAEARCKERS